MDNIGIVITAVVLTVCGDSTESLKNEFNQIGFTVEAADQTTLLVTGNSNLFEETFDIEVLTNDEKTSQTGVFVKSVDSHNNEATMLTEWSSSLPVEYQNRIKKIEFEQPIAFGPTDY